MKPCMREANDGKNSQHFQTVDKESVFSISPSSGKFQPDASFEFEISSSSTKVRIEQVYI